MTRGGTRTLFVLFSFLMTLRILYLGFRSLYFFFAQNCVKPKRRDQSCILFDLDIKDFFGLIINDAK